MAPQPSCGQTVPSVFVAPPRREIRLLSQVCRVRSDLRFVTESLQTLQLADMGVERVRPRAQSDLRVPTGCGTQTTFWRLVESFGECVEK